jgi:hypothetical protein
VPQLAEELRRDRIIILRSGYPMGYKTIRYDLSDGRFADRHGSRFGRYLGEYRYTVFLPGGSASGGAEVSFAARTQKEALALAGLARVRGRCAECGNPRPRCTSAGGDPIRPSPVPVAMTIKNIPEDWGWTTEFDGWGNPIRTATPAMVALYREIENIHAAYNYDNSDAMTDYFDRKYWGSVSTEVGMRLPRY